MKIRVFSDIHIDINQNFPFSLRGKEKDDFTLIPGDISGNVKGGARWIQQNIHNGMFIVGNHDPSYNDLGWTIQKQKEYLAEKFPVDGKVTFLDNAVGTMSKQIPDTNILVIGSTLYTDYRYADSRMKHNVEHSSFWRERANEMGVEDLMVAANMCMASRGLNDFRWGHVEDESDDRGLKQRLVRPTDYLKWFSKTFDEMRRLVEENPDKDIIVMTHHCPTPKCISSQYIGNDMNASYVSDLEEFMTSHPNIRAWVCGHVHSQTITTVGKEEKGQLIVCNPRGYEKHLESSTWNPNTYIDTDTWTTSTEPYENKKLQEARDKAQEDFMKLAPFLFF